MRKIIKYTIVGLGLMVVVYLVFQGYSTYRLKKELEVSIQTLPNAKFVSLLKDTLTLADFDKNKALAIIYFHPECEHCQYEAEEIGLNAPDFLKAQLVMITPDDSIPRIKDFCKKYHLWEVDNLEVLLDCGGIFKQTFGKAILPSVYIYDNQQKLKKKYLGETKPEAIIAAIQD